MLLGEISIARTSREGTVKFLLQYLDTFLKTAIELPENIHGTKNWRVIYYNIRKKKNLREISLALEKKV